MVVSVAPGLDSIAYLTGEANEPHKSVGILHFGGEARVLPDSKDACRLMWSPSGDHIAALRQQGEPGTTELWLYKADGSSARRVSVLPLSGGH